MRRRRIRVALPPASSTSETGSPNRPLSPARRSPVERAGSAPEPRHMVRAARNGAGSSCGFGGEFESVCLVCSKSPLRKTSKSSRNGWLKLREFAVPKVFKMVSPVPAVPSVGAKSCCTIFSRNASLLSYGQNWPCQRLVQRCQVEPS